MANVWVPVWIVTVPLFEMEEMTAPDKVLLINVSIPSNVAKVRVPKGMVTVPPLKMEEMTGAVRVLFVNV